MAKRSKSGKILIYIGEDSRKHMRRVAALEKAASDRANRKAAREAASIQRKAFRKVGGATMQMARKAARDRATLAKREARRRGNNKPTEEYNRQREENARKKRKKRPFHPRGPYATEKYTSYARREERSKRLRATRSSPNTFTCNGYTIKVTIGSNPVPLSCTCPDFTQIGGGRNWSGSNAGPFNPCKHMMAVRDQNDQKWSCSGGVCSPDANGPYNSQAECQAALVNNVFNSPTGTKFFSNLTDGRIKFPVSGATYYPSGTTAEIRPFGGGFFDAYINGTRMGLSNGFNIGVLNIYGENLAGNPVPPALGCP